MKKLLLTITMAAGGLGSLATSAQAHPGNQCGYHSGCGYHNGCGYRYSNNCGHYGRWYWHNGCRSWQVVVVPGPVPPCP